MCSAPAGAKDYPGDDLDRTLENMGASLEFNIGSTERHRAASGACAENAQEVLTILADLMQRPGVPRGEARAGEDRTAAVIADRNDEPMDIVFRTMGDIVYGKDHPYARSTEYATIEAVTRDDLVAFHKAHVRPRSGLPDALGRFRCQRRSARRSSRSSATGRARGGCRLPSRPPAQSCPAAASSMPRRPG